MHDDEDLSVLKDVGVLDSRFREDLSYVTQRSAFISAFEVHWGLEVWMDVVYPSIHSGVSQVIGTQFLVYHLSLLGSILLNFMSYTSGSGSARRCTTCSLTGISDWIYPPENQLALGPRDVIVFLTGVIHTAICLCCEHRTVVARSRFKYLSNTNQSTSAVFRPLTSAQQHYHTRRSPVPHCSFH